MPHLLQVEQLHSVTESNSALTSRRTAPQWHDRVRIIGHLLRFPLESNYDRLYLNGVHVGYGNIEEVTVCSAPGGLRPGADLSLTFTELVSSQEMISGFVDS